MDHGIGRESLEKCLHGQWVMYMELYIEYVITSLEGIQILKCWEMVLSSKVPVQHKYHHWVPLWSISSSAQTRIFTQITIGYAR